MDDQNKLLDGTVDDVTAGLSGRSHDELLKLRTAETAGKNRKGVIDALDEAIEEADRSRTGGMTQMEPAVRRTSAPAIAADLDQSGPAHIAPATAFSTSGAPVQVVPDVDPSHPAVDNDPRAGTTVDQNRIDFNDPTISGSEAVKRALGNQA